ncbi:MAG TPA: AAA family ATPase [Azospirillaceae bacterium]|nr:AAA family ATPase [Azospirillaceae bacterium]
MKTVAFFNNKGGVGKTSLTYHLAWMLSDKGIRVLAADFDPQANLTSMFLDENRLEGFWPDDEHPHTIYGVVDPILEGEGDIIEPYVEIITEGLGLIVGDLQLARFEDKLSDAWPRCLDRDQSALRVTTAFYRALLKAADANEADVILMDVGPNLGALNRAALVSADYVVIPLGPDLFSLQGLRNLGPTLINWRNDWEKRRSSNPKTKFPLPTGDMSPLGYVVLQHAVRLDRPVKYYERWMNRIPPEYKKSVLGMERPSISPVSHDSHCLAQIKHYRSLMPLAMEVRKPIFHLKPADGALGAQLTTARRCYDDFYALARRIGQAVGLPEF